MKDWSLIILAGGKGTRLRTSTPKPLVEIAGKPLIEPILTLGKKLGFSKTVVVISEFTSKVAERYPDPAFRYLLVEPKGTGYVTATALKEVTTPFALIAQADDSFFYTEELLHALMRQHEKTAADFTVGVATVTEDLPYSSVTYDSDRHLLALNTSASDKLLPPPKEVAAGLYAAGREWLASHLPQVAPSDNGEIGLPFVVQPGLADLSRIYAFPIPADQWSGINTPEELEKAARKASKIS